QQVRRLLSPLSWRSQPQLNETSECLSDPIVFCVNLLTLDKKQRMKSLIPSWKTSCHTHQWQEWLLLWLTPSRTKRRLRWRLQRARSESFRCWRMRRLSILVSMKELKIALSRITCLGGNQGSHHLRRSNKRHRPKEEFL